MGKQSVFVATPCYGGLVYYTYLRSLLDTVVHLNNAGVGVKIAGMGNESLITRARNQMVAQFLETDCTHMMFIDAGGGADLADRLHELGYDKRVKAIYFGASPLDDLKYKNKRGEMWGLAAEWLNDENLEVDIPDSDSLQADLTASPYDRDSHDRIILWRKEKIKEKYGFSPDEGDALALTFAEPFKVKQVRKRKYPKISIA